MPKIHKRKLLHQLTSTLLIARGYAKPDGYDIEWDPMEPDSQYSMCYEDVEIVLNSLEKFGYEISEKNAPMTPTVTHTYSAGGGHVRIK